MDRALIHRKSGKKTGKARGETACFMRETSLPRTRGRCWDPVSNDGSFQWRQADGVHMLAQGFGHGRESPLSVPFLLVRSPQSLPFATSCPALPAWGCTLPCFPDASRTSCLSHVSAHSEVGKQWVLLLPLTDRETGAQNRCSVGVEPRLRTLV